VKFLRSPLETKKQSPNVDGGWNTGFLMDFYALGGMANAINVMITL
jgi:hypothetical protein